MTLSLIPKTYRRLQVYLHNSYWIIGEKVLSIGLGFVATVVVARYLGPQDFGSLAYAFSLVTLFAAAGHMGLSGLVVREIVKAPATRSETLGTTAALKLLGVLLGYLALVAYAAVYEGLDAIEFYLIAIAGAALLFRPLDVIDFWFQAFVQARYVAVARISSEVVATVLKLSLVMGGTGLVYFAIAPPLQAIVAGLLLIIFFRLKSNLRITEWRFNRVRAGELLGQGWIIYLGSIFAVVCLKVDQVMLRWLTDTGEVGQYAVAAQFSEAWYFVPTAIVASLFPKLIEIRENDESLFHHRLQQLFDVLFTIGLVVAVVMTVAAGWIIALFFGPEYAASASILVIHIWAAIFIFMRAAVSKWILIENVLYFSLVTQGLGALANIIMNYFLIPLYGGQGAAYATLVSYAIASFFALIVYRRTRRVFWLMLWAMFAPLRYPAKYVSLRMT